jgi:hypothetical protein
LEGFVVKKWAVARIAIATLEEELETVGGPEDVLCIRRSKTSLSI